VRALEAYPWPGNVRELRNVIERAVALCPGPQVQLRDLPEAMRLPPNGPAAAAPCPPPARAAALPSPTTLAQTKEETEILRITEALRKHRNNRLRAAAELGISRMGLYKKLHKYGLFDTVWPRSVSEPRSR
jgi:DNA-binding NtrC family response regulator